MWVSEEVSNVSWSLNDLQMTMQCEFKKNKNAARFKLTHILNCYLLYSHSSLFICDTIVTCDIAYLMLILVQQINNNNNNNEFSVVEFYMSKLE